MCLISAKNENKKISCKSTFKTDTFSKLGRKKNMILTSQLAGVGRKIRMTIGQPRNLPQGGNLGSNRIAGVMSQYDRSQVLHMSEHAGLSV